MTRKRFMKLLMGRGVSRNKARQEAEYVIARSRAISRINHEWKEEEKTTDGCLRRIVLKVYGHRAHLSGYKESIEFIDAVLLPLLKQPQYIRKK